MALRALNERMGMEIENSFSDEVEIGDEKDYKNDHIQKNVVKNSQTLF